MPKNIKITIQLCSFHIVGKESACSAGDPGSVPRSGRSPGEGNGNPLQYSCPDNPMDQGAWGATVHGVAKSRTLLSDFSSSALCAHTSKVMLKILQARLQQYVSRELSDVQAGFRKGRGTRDQTANICWIIKKQESSRKTSISALLTTPKPSTMWITINCGKF